MDLTFSPICRINKTIQCSRWAPIFDVVLPPSTDSLYINQKHYTPIVEPAQHLKAELVPWLIPHAMKFRLFPLKIALSFLWPWARLKVNVKRNSVSLHPLIGYCRSSHMSNYVILLAVGNPH